MFQKVIVGADGREGEDAIALARLLAAPDAAVRYAGLTSEVHGAARRHRADLLVVGSPGRGLTSAVLDVDTRGALQDLRYALAIAPPGYAGTARALHVREIGVGCDVSPESVAAIRVAYELAVRHRATVRATSIVPIGNAPYGTPALNPWKRIAERLMAMGAPLEGVKGAVGFGEPAEALANFSVELDLLIVGARSYRTVGRLLAESASDSLLPGVQCPLLIVPRGARGRAVPPAGQWAEPRRAELVR